VRLLQLGLHQNLLLLLLLLLLLVGLCQKVLRLLLLLLGAMCSWQRQGGCACWHAEGPSNSPPAGLALNQLSGAQRCHTCGA
jgi:hypothetical protein